MSERRHRRHARLRHPGGKWKSHLVVYTGEDLDTMAGTPGDDYYLKQARKLIRRSEWPGFTQVKAVCLDESDEDDPVVAGVVSANEDDELLFLTDPEYNGQGVASLMVEALLPEVEDATLEEVLSGDWDPPYSAVAGSVAGAGFLSSLPGKLGWKVWALIRWSGFDEEKQLMREERMGHAKAARRSAGSGNTLTISPELYQIWNEYEVELWDGEAGPRAAFVAALQDARRSGKKYVVPLNEAVTAYLHDHLGPIYGHDDLLADKLEHAERDPESWGDPRVLRAVLKELTTMHSRFPKRQHRGHAKAARRSSGRAPGKRLAISPELYDIWLGTEVETLSEGSEPVRWAFAEALQKSTRGNKDWRTLQLAPELEAWLCNPSGPLYQNDDLLQERLYDEEHARGGNPRPLRKAINELKRLQRRFPKRGGHAAAPLLDRPASPFQAGVYRQLGYGGTGQPDAGFSAGMGGHARAAVAAGPLLTVGTEAGSFTGTPRQCAEYLARVNPRRSVAVSLGAEHDLMGHREYHVPPARGSSAGSRIQTIELDLQRMTLGGGHAQARKKAARGTEGCSVLPGVSSGSCPPADGIFEVKSFPSDVKAWQRELARRTVPADASAWTKAAKAAGPILTKYGIRLGKQLGCGSFACAFEVKNKPHLIAKITGDPADAAAWQLVIDSVGRGHWPEGLSHVECVEVLPMTVSGGDDRKLFFMLQERMLPLSTPERRCLEAHSEEDEEDLVVINSILQKNRKHAQWYAKQCKIKPDLLLRLIDTIEWLEGLGIKWHDLHGGNVMAQGQGKDRVLKIMDLGYSEVPNTRVAIMEKPARHAAAALPLFGAHPRAGGTALDVVLDLLEEREGTRPNILTPPPRDEDEIWASFTEKIVELCASSDPTLRSLALEVWQKHMPFGEPMIRACPDATVEQLAWIAHDCAQDMYALVQRSGLPFEPGASPERALQLLKRWAEGDRSRGLAEELAQTADGMRTLMEPWDEEDEPSEAEIDYLRGTRAVLWEAITVVTRREHGSDLRKRRSDPRVSAESNMWAGQCLRTAAAALDNYYMAQLGSTRKAQAARIQHMTRHAQIVARYIPDPTHPDAGPSDTRGSRRGHAAMRHAAMPHKPAPAGSDSQVLLDWVEEHQGRRYKPFDFDPYDADQRAWTKVVISLCGSSDATTRGLALAAWRELPYGTEMVKASAGGSVEALAQIAHECCVDALPLLDLISREIPAGISPTAALHLLEQWIAGDRSPELFTELESASGAVRTLAEPWDEENEEWMISEEEMEIARPMVDAISHALSVVTSSLRQSRTRRVTPLKAAHMDAGSCLKSLVHAHERMLTISKGLSGSARWRALARYQRKQAEVVAKHMPEPGGLDPEYARLTAEPGVVNEEFNPYMTQQLGDTPRGSRHSGARALFGGHAACPHPPGEICPDTGRICDETGHPAAIVAQYYGATARPDLMPRWEANALYRMSHPAAEYADDEDDLTSGLE